MQKIGIYFLGARRLQLLRCHLLQLSRAKYKNYHFYLLCNEVKQEHVDLMKQYLPDGSFSAIVGFDLNNDYMHKINFAINQEHIFSIKMDEDCLMLSESWDRFFSLIEGMTEKDLFCTGAISNGIPSCDFFINNFIPEAKLS